MTYQEFITKHEISHSYLAKRMGMGRGTFNNKLNPNHPTTFQTGEKINLQKIDNP
jgi:hypothetical protein